MSEAGRKVAQLAGHYVVQTLQVERAERAESLAVTVWAAAAEKLLRSGVPTEHERASRGAWLSARRERWAEEDKLRALGAQLDQAFAAWDREGPTG